MGSQLKKRAYTTPFTTTSRPRVDTTVEGAKARERKTIQLLGDLGPLKGSKLTEMLGYKSPSSSAVFLSKLVKRGTVTRTKRYYHLKGQEIPGLVKPKKELDFFDYPGKLGELRRYIKLHQDEPVTIAAISRACNYANESGAHNPIYRMLKNGTLKRYKAPEDWGPVYRYQYLPEELSGVTTTKLAEPVVDESDNIGEEVPWEDAEVPAAPAINFDKFIEQAKRADDMVNDQQEMNQVTQESLEAGVAELTTTINLVEKYGKEFMWKTGQRNVREFSVWLREQRLAAGEQSNDIN